MPDAEDRATVHRIIYDELVAGVVDPRSSAAYRAVIARLADRGAQAVILGCNRDHAAVGAETARCRCSTHPPTCRAALDRALA